MNDVVHFTSLEWNDRHTGVRAICICGWQSGKWGTEANAIRVADHHENKKDKYGQEQPKK